MTKQVQSFKFQIQNRIENLRKELGREVEILAVTKGRSFEEIQACLDAGIHCIGENRVQEAALKFPFLTHSVKKHLIGHLQTNKVKKVVELFGQIDSVDSIRLAEALNEEARKQARVLPILIQVNVAKDPKKHGFKVDEVFEALSHVGRNCSHLKVKGLMTILPYFEDVEEARPYFQKMRGLFEAIRDKGIFGIEIEELSMGMSHDYRIAVEEGATVVRVGKGIFGF